MKSIELIPFHGELPSSYAERVGAAYSSMDMASLKKKKGQFFTPLEIALSDFFKSRVSDAFVLNANNS
ncbi:MAG: hypothetical protein PHD11_09285 [Bacteroidales bacterium]|nr:hypothetical protein [Bacteroidales bacterium]MDD4671260.1 hypothetical protein [Bacteroidales bacterium]